MTLTLPPSSCTAQIVISDMLPESKTVLPTQQLALLGYFFLLFVGLESIFVYYIVRANKNYEIQKRKKQARARFTRRWETMKAMASRELTEEAAREAVESASKRPGCAPWPRKRRPHTAAQGAGDEVAVPIPMPESQQRPPIPRLPYRQRQQQQQGVEPQAGDGDLMGSRRSSTVTFVPMGGVGDGDSSSDGSDFQAPGSELSEYASDEEGNGRAEVAAPLPDWWGRTSHKYQAMWAEIRRNPDYALFIATRIDTLCFWFTCIGYIIAAAIMLAVNASHQAQLRM